MAAAPKKAPSDRMYGRGPRIESEREASGGEAGGGMAAAPEAASDTTRTPDMGPEADVMSGTDGIPTEHHEQSTDRASLHHRQSAEHLDMHHRHEREHLMRAMGRHKEDMAAMHERQHREKRQMHTTHEREMRDMHTRHSGNGPTGGIEEKDVGKGGTEPMGEAA